MKSLNVCVFVYSVFIALCGATFRLAHAQAPSDAAPAVKAPTTSNDPNDRIDPELLKVDVPALIHVRTEKDVERVRKELIAFLWKNDGSLPTRKDLEVKQIDAPKEIGDSAASSQKFTIKLGKDFSSVVYFFQPKKPNKKLGIFHHGHTGEIWGQGGSDSTKFMLDRGYSVLAFYMPLFGENNEHKPKEFHHHDHLKKLASNDFEPITLFLEPVLVAINYTMDKYKFEDVTMIGLSGGGWTTTLYAAIDPRVTLSVPVAGSYPDYIRKGHNEDIGDWEQYYPALYKIANYLDLYILGATGKNRHQRQALNKYDSCCFAGLRYQTYEKHVAKAVNDIGSGKFDVFLDDTHREHMISQHVLEKAFGPMLGKGK
jgi:hypothetical protein